VPTILPGCARASAMDSETVAAAPGSPGGPVSENGRSCCDDGAHGRGERRRRMQRLSTLIVRHPKRQRGCCRRHDHGESTGRRVRRHEPAASPVAIAKRATQTITMTFIPPTRRPSRRSSWQASSSAPARTPRAGRSAGPASGIPPRPVRRLPRRSSLPSPAAEGAVRALARGDRRWLAGEPFGHEGCWKRAALHCTRRAPSTRRSLSAA
jgi:hypothetical protein